MKARVIKTGEIVNVVPVDGGWCDTDYDTYSRQYNDYELDFDFQDWESFRREAAKDILAGIAHTFVNIEDSYMKRGVEVSIKLADELIKQLKQDEK